MAKLICTKEFLNNLIKESIIEPQGNNKFVIYTKANLKGESYPITISCSHDVSPEDVTVDEIIDNSIYSLDQWYNLIRIEFPTNAGAHLNTHGRNLRTGNKTKIKKRIQALIDESYNLTAVLNAIKYEVWFRKKGSIINDNKLEFMQGLEAWLNNTSNVEAMIERSISSNEYKLTMNINDKQGTKRKIKLS